MKAIWPLLISILFIANLNAMCSSNGLSAFPEGKYVKQNAIFVIAGYASSREIIKGLNKKYPVYLVSGSHKIKLTVREILVGQYSLTQAILIPEMELKSGLEYTLVIDKLAQFESLNRWNDDLKKNETIKYTVIEGRDTTNPTFSETPKEINKSLIHFGCGPAIYVDFSCNVIDSSDYLIKATVKNMKSRKETSYYLNPDEGIISIGHGMCSGAFNFGESDDYEVVFSIMDASGNETPWTGEPIKFTKPNNENSEH